MVVAKPASFKTRLDLPSSPNSLVKVTSETLEA